MSRAFQSILRDTTISTQQQLHALERLVYASEEMARPRPVAIYTAGPPGAGKSSTLETCLKQLQMRPENFIIHDPDFITQSLRYFKESPKTHQTIIQSMNRISHPLNDLFIEKSVSNGLNIIIGGTSRNPDTKLAHISRLRDRGYKIIMIATHAPLQTILERVRRRAEKTGRAINDDVVATIYTDIKGALPIYATSELIDIMYIYDNRGRSSRLAFRKNIDGTTCCTIALKELELTIPCETACDDQSIPQHRPRIKGRAQSVQAGVP